MSTITTKKYAKNCKKTLHEKIDVVAQFHAHKISPVRIAYRTGINDKLVDSLIRGECHADIFKAKLSFHRKSRMQQRLKDNLRLKGAARVSKETLIIQEYESSTEKK